MKTWDVVRDAVISACAAGLVFGAGWLGLSQTLGAHPFWAVNVALYGGLAGAGLGFCLRLWGAFRVPLVIAAVLLTGASFAAAHFGKVEFAASYAENSAAGLAWFFGWIATCTGATTALALLPRVRRPG